MINPNASYTYECATCHGRNGAPLNPPDCGNNCFNSGCHDDSQHDSMAVPPGDDHSCKVCHPSEEEE